MSAGGDEREVLLDLVAGRCCCAADVSAIVITLEAASSERDGPLPAGRGAVDPASADAREGSARHRMKTTEGEPK